MGSPAKCSCKPLKVVVTVRRANYSAFSGYHHTRSDYSEVRCVQCASRWRTKAAYVDRSPDFPRGREVYPGPLDCTGLFWPTQKEHQS